MQDPLIMAALMNKRRQIERERLHRDITPDPLDSEETMPVRRRRGLMERLLALLGR